MKSKSNEKEKNQRKNKQRDRERKRKINQFLPKSGNDNKKKWRKKTKIEMKSMKATLAILTDVRCTDETKKFIL